MKLAHLAHLASTRAPTGAEQSLALLAADLRKRGHEVEMAVPGDWAMEARVRAAGVELTKIPVRMCWLVQWDRQPLWRQLGRAVRWVGPDPGVERLRRWVGEIAPDVVHVNCLPHLRGAEAARAAGVPVVWHLREILPPGLRRRWFATRLRRHATRIVAVSEAVAGWVREEGLGDRVEVVHNGVEAPLENPDRSEARKAFGLAADAIVVGLFSQLVKHKGALDFVEAAHLAASESDRLRFLIAGGGPVRFLDELQSAVARGPAADRIRLVPPQPEIWPLLAAVDVAAITTLWPDPLPRVVMEAMAVGRPVVGYAGGGVPEMVVDGETGILTQPRDVKALARAMTKLAGDRDLAQALGVAGSARAQELFGVDRHVDRMEAILEEAAAGSAQVQPL